MTTSEHHKTKLGYEHYVLFPNDGNRHEIIDGDHYMNPAPSPYHQTVSKRLQYQLYSKIELTGLGLVFDAPIDIQLGEHTIVQPDLVVLVNGTKAKITPTKINGAPDLVVEILSPSTAENDLSLKKGVYQKAGVREYWIVDPFEPKITKHELIDGQYVSQPVDPVTGLAILPDVEISVEELW